MSPPEAIHIVGVWPATTTAPAPREVHTLLWVRVPQGGPLSSCVVDIKMRCGSREPVNLVVSQHLYDPTAVVSEETPATTGVFVDVPCRAYYTHAARFLYYERGALTNSSRISNRTENCVRQFAWLHDNVSVLKTFLSRCVLRCHVDKVTNVGSPGAPQ
jgi:hypothetical protein